MFYFAFSISCAARAHWLWHHPVVEGPDYVVMSEWLAALALISVLSLIPAVALTATSVWEWWRRRP
jgi:hypothetical protein